MTQELKSGVTRAWRRILNSFGVGVVSHIDDSGPVQLMQVQIGQLEVRDNTQAVYHFGFACRPPVGSRVMLNFMGGDRSVGFAVATHDQATRPRNLADGEAMIYDKSGNHVYLQAGGTIEIIAATKVHVSTPVLEVVGSITATGEVTAMKGAGQVSLSTHRTGQVMPGTGQSGPPVANT